MPKPGRSVTRNEGDLRHRFGVVDQGGLARHLECHRLVDPEHRQSPPLVEPSDQRRFLAGYIATRRAVQRYATTHEASALALRDGPFHGYRGRVAAGSDADLDL